MSPCGSDDLLEIVDERDGKVFVLRSRDDAEDWPNYEEVALLCELPGSTLPPANHQGP
jgi:hypothetical protein